MNFPLEKFRDKETPFYFYDLDLLRKTLWQVKENAGNIHVHYAIKANHDSKILQTIAAAGFGADCVSAGEISAAVEAGIPANKIFFAGVGKTDREIGLGLDLGIGCFNVESIPEMEVINELAAQRKKIAPIAIRVNPNIDAHTHEYITTGLEENKFGINLQQLHEAIGLATNLSNINLIGLHFHIGSQVLNMEAFALLCKKIMEIEDEFPQLTLNVINVGGGLGIDYDNPDGNLIPDFKNYFDTLHANLKLKPGQELHCELGRSIVAQCGSVISRVIYVKEATKKKFIIIDAGMTELIRPALYGAHHLIQNLSAPTIAPEETYDIVGPVCESSDIFEQDARLPETHRSDLLAIRSAGAYGETMSSNYNLRKLNPTVYEE